ncbi:cell division protein FtsL [bacterium JGI 053]|nr:cell division protein FtsL [bacterium JGI 053]
MSRPAGPSRWEAPRAGAEARGRRRRSRLGWIAYAAVLVAALASVVWRQTVGLERFRELETVREEVAVAEAERDELTTRILELQRRDRIARYAQERLGMHVARDEEVVLLPVPGSAAPRADSAAEDAR